MRNLLHFLIALGAAGLLLGTAGCSRKARLAQVLARGDRYFNAGQYNAAEIEYLNAQKIDHLDPRAFGQLGIIYFSEGRVGKSYRYLVAGSTLDPTNVDLHLKIGLYDLSFGKLQAAKDAANFVLDRRPADEDAPLLLAQAVSGAQEIATARDRLNSLKIPEAEKASVLVALGTLELKQRHIPAAEALYKRAFDVNQKSAAACTALGALYWDQKKISRKPANTSHWPLT